MDREELKNRIFNVLDESKLGSVATIMEDRPWVRYMALQRGDSFELFTTSFANARKIEQIKKNKNVHVAVGGDPCDWKKPYVNIQAEAQVLTDVETKKKCWHEMLGQFFSGPEDPNFVVIKISPKVIEFIAPGTHEPCIYHVD